MPALYPNHDADVSRDKVLQEHIEKLKKVVTPGHAVDLVAGQLERRQSVQLSLSKIKWCIFELYTALTIKKDFNLHD